MTRLGKQPALDVPQQALEVLRTVVVEVHLKAADLGNVPFLTLGGVLADGVDAEIDVVALRVQVAEPGLGSAGGCLGRGKALLNSAVRICARDGENSHALGAVKHAVEKPNGCLVSHKSPWGRVWQYALQHSLRGGSLAVAVAPEIPEQGGNTTRGRAVRLRCSSNPA